MKITVAIMIFLLSLSAAASEFVCTVTFDGQTTSLQSEKERVVGSFGKYDVSVNFAYSDDDYDHYDFQIIQADPSAPLFKGTIIQDCGFGTPDLFISCGPRR